MLYNKLVALTFRGQEINIYDCISREKKEKKKRFFLLLEPMKEIQEESEDDRRLQF